MGWTKKTQGEGGIKITMEGEERKSAKKCFLLFLSIP